MSISSSTPLQVDSPTLSSSKVNSSAIELANVDKWYGPTQAVKSLSMRVEPGEFVALLGPSGCGKTSTLRVIAGLEKLDRGSLRIGGADMTKTPPHRRKLGFVPQSYALFPHLTIFDNVGFGLRMRRCSRHEIIRAVREALALVQLEDFAERYPWQLSGGQQQRVALARALAVTPTVLLLDEPMAALDRKLRAQMQIEVRSLQRRLGLATIMVTHDQEEAMAMADRVAVMNNGEIVQFGTPREIYEKPRSRFVANFIGLSNVMPTVLKSDRKSTAGETIARFASAQISELQLLEGYFIVRPEDITLSREQSTDGCTSLAGRIAHVAFLGSVIHYHVEMADGTGIVAMEKNAVISRHDRRFGVNDPVYITWDTRCEHIVEP